MFCVLAAVLSAYEAIVELCAVQVHDSYDDLINDPDIDVIFNPLPNGLHAEWSMKAMVNVLHFVGEFIDLKFALLRPRASTFYARSRWRQTRKKPSRCRCVHSGTTAFSSRPFIGGITPYTTAWQTFSTADRSAGFSMLTQSLR